MALMRANELKTNKIFIDGLIKTLMNFKVRDAARANVFYSYIDAMQENKRTGAIPTADLEAYIRIKFGDTYDKENDQEYKLAKIIALYTAINYLIVFKINNESKQEIAYLMSNVRKTLRDHMPEFSVSFDADGLFRRYVPMEYISVYQSLDDISNKVSDILKDILNPMKGDYELAALVIMANDIIEKIEVETLTTLETVDKNIFIKSKELVSKLASKLDKTKGLKDKTGLTIKDIAYNFALNAAMIQKLIKINEDNK